MTKGRIHYFLKHTFIPHEGNDYKPHFFREAAIVTILAISIFLLGVSFGSSFFLKKTVLGASIAANVLVDLANETRLAYNEPLLIRNPLLDKAAELKGNDMASRGYFSHDSPDGITPWHWFKEVGYNFLYAGENLAVNFTESTDVQNAWLNSPKHKENLINKNFKEIGIATVEGVYKNTPTIFVVQMFGTPAKASTQTKSAPKKVAVTGQTTLKKLTATGTPEVKGETSAVMPKEQEATPPEQIILEKIVETPTFAAVKNNEAGSTTDPQVITPPTYSTWYGKMLFASGDSVDIIYKLLIGIVLVALFLMIVIEIRRQHFKHISYGVLLVLTLTILIYINQAFIN